MSASRKLMMTIALVALFVGVAGVQTWSAFSGTTSNPSNSFAAGTVAISDNDSGTALFSITNAKPGTSSTQCIKVTYTGSLNSNVELYTPESLNAVAAYVNLTIQPGTATGVTFPGCGTFSAIGSAIYSGTLSAWQTAHSGWSNGLAVNNQSSSATWAQNDAVVYQITLSQADNNSANGGSGGALSTGSFSFTWEARNT